MPNYNNKIVIGSANFGQYYGLANTNTNEKEIKKILKFAFKNNIKCLDTAINYGNAQKLLGMHNLEMWNIDTKIPKVPLKVKKIKSWLEKRLEITLSDLNVSMETVNLTRRQMQQDVATTVLAQANKTQSSLVSLVDGSYRTYLNAQFSHLK